MNMIEAKGQSQDSAVLSVSTGVSELAGVCDVSGVPGGEGSDSSSGSS